jgi:glutaredoxin
MSTEQAGHRCETHGLAAGPDGSCVLCRRQPKSTATSGRGFVALAALLVVAGAATVLTLRYTGDSGQSEAATVPVSPQVAADDEAAPAARPETTPERDWRKEKDWRKQPIVRRRPVPARPPGPRQGVVAPAPRIAPSAPVKPRQPSKAELLAEARRIPIELYYTTWCPACKRARAWLRANRLAVRAYDIERNTSAKAIHARLNPRGSIPVLRVGGQTYVGFRGSTVWKMLMAQARARLIARAARR